MSLPLNMGIKIKMLYCLNCVILREVKAHGKEIGLLATIIGLPN
jgi:hypothetical protein